MNQIIEHIKARDVKWLSLLVKEKGSEYLKKIKDAHRNSTILLASEMGCTEVVEYCIFIGCNINDVNIAGDTPLIVASKRGHFEVVQLLATQGAIVECANYRGNTPLHYAAFGRYGEIVVYLAATCSATVNVMNQFKRYPTDVTSEGLKMYLEGYVFNRSSRTTRS